METSHYEELSSKIGRVETEVGEEGVRGFAQSLFFGVPSPFFQLLRLPRLALSTQSPPSRFLSSAF